MTEHPFELPWEIMKAPDAEGVPPQYTILDKRGVDIATFTGPTAGVNVARVIAAVNSLQLAPAGAEG